MNENMFELITWMTACNRNEYENEAICHLNWIIHTLFKSETQIQQQQQKESKPNAYYGKRHTAKWIKAFTVFYYQTQLMFTPHLTRLKTMFNILIT